MAELKKQTKVAEYLQSMMAAIIDSASEIGWGQRPGRPVGISASSTLHCPRELLMKDMNLAPYYDNPGGNKMAEHGTDLHEKMDRWIEQFFAGFPSEIYTIAVKRGYAFQNAEDHEDIVTGTPDQLWWDVEGNIMYLLDFKFTSPEAFDKRRANSKFGGPLDGHCGQLATYRQMRNVQELKDRLGPDYGNPCKLVTAIVYINSTTLQPWVEPVTDRWDKIAEEYWTDYYAIRKFFIESGKVFLPMGVPNLGEFQCRYCDLFPPLKPALYPTKKAKKDAEQAIGKRNFEACTSCATLKTLGAAIIDAATEEEASCAFYPVALYPEE